MVEIVQEYINIMACLLKSLLDVPDFKLSLLRVSTSYEEISNSIRTRFQTIYSQKASDLLNTIHELLDEMHNAPDNEQLCYAVSLCLCMDQMICYADDTEGQEIVWTGGRIYLQSIVPFKSEKTPIIIKTLNQNYAETGVCIAPKFPVSKAHVPCGTDIIERDLSSRSALFGINRDLRNIMYYPWREDGYHVVHIILPERSRGGQVLPQETRIIFSPLTDCTDLLVLQKVSPFDMEGIQCTGLALEKISNAQYVENRFTDNWKFACEQEPDIFFAPEMLSTEQMVRIEYGGSSFLKPLLKEVTLKGLRPPRITILPTHWSNGINRLLIFDETGRLLGAQCKCFPYIDQKNDLVEALLPQKSADVLLIHMKNQQRIAVVICAEFLASSHYVDDFLCRQLGATLILIPSYSSGERDFVEMLPALKPYGTSAIWGNCCGAVKNQEKRIIGACSYAGIDMPRRFGSICKCGFNCGTLKKCLFQVDIPTDVIQKKPDSPCPPPILHICQ